MSETAALCALTETQNNYTELAHAWMWLGVEQPLLGMFCYSGELLYCHSVSVITQRHNCLTPHAPGPD